MYPGVHREDEDDAEAGRRRRQARRRVEIDVSRRSRRWAVGRIVVAAAAACARSPRPMRASTRRAVEARRRPRTAQAAVAAEAGGTRAGRGRDSAGAGQRPHDRRGRRQHHRAGRRARRADRGHRHRVDERQGDQGDRVDRRKGGRCATSSTPLTAKSTSGGNEKIAPYGEIVPFREPDYAAGPQGAIDTHRASVVSTYLGAQSHVGGDRRQAARNEGAGRTTRTRRPEAALFQRRAGHHHPRDGDDRRQQRRAVPEIGRGQLGRPVRSDRVSDD